MVTKFAAKTSDFLNQLKSLETQELFIRTIHQDSLKTSIIGDYRSILYVISLTTTENTRIIYKIVDFSIWYGESEYKTIWNLD